MKLPVKYFCFFVLYIVIGCQKSNNISNGLDSLILDNRVYGWDDLRNIEYKKVDTPTTYFEKTAKKIGMNNITINQLHDKCFNKKFHGANSTGKFWYNEYLVLDNYLLVEIKDNILSKYNLKLYEISYWMQEGCSIVFDGDSCIYPMKDFDCNYFIHLLNIKLGKRDTKEKIIDSINLHNLIFGPSGKIKPWDSIIYISSNNYDQR